MTNFVDQNSVQNFIDQNSIVLFVDQNGIFLGTAGTTPTTTVLTSSVNPTIVGGSTTFTATVTPSAATGLVTFLDGAGVIGAAALGSGVATFPYSSLGTGIHSITASYGGDSTYAGSTSSILTQTVNSVSAPPTLLMAQICMSFLLLIGGIATYYLDNMT